MDVEKVLKLAGLDIEGEEFLEEIKQILNHIELLKEVDVSGVDPLVCPISHSIRLREDACTSSLTVEEIASTSPQFDGRFFPAGKVMEGEL